MDDQRPVGAVAPAAPNPGYPPSPGPAAHLGPRRTRSRRLVGLAALLAIGVGGGGAAVALSGGGDGDDEAGGAGDGVVLLPAASPGRDDFTGDLDLLAPDRRAQPGGVRVRLPTTDLDEPVVLAGLGIRGAEPGLYTAARDEPTCDVDQLDELLLAEGGADPEPATVAWFGAIARNIEAEEYDEYLDGLTAVRLRLDTRVVANGFVDGAAVPYPAVLQAGTAVLVDELGVPRVRCTGGTPLGEADPVSGMDREEALDLDARAADPDDAWAGFDPAAVVVVEAHPTDDGFELASATGADADGDETFVRRTGSNGDRDRGVFTPDDGEPAPGCGDECHELEIAITASAGTATSLSFEGIADPSETDDQRLFWSDAAPTTYKFSVDREWETYGAIGPDDDVQAIMTAFYADPAHEGELMLQPDPLTGAPMLLRCADGPVTITVTVDGTVARTFDEDVSCVGTNDLEFVLE
jgi:hypothetical protein